MQEVDRHLMDWAPTGLGPCWIAPYWITAPAASARNPTITAEPVSTTRLASAVLRGAVRPGVGSQNRMLLILRGRGWAVVIVVLAPKELSGSSGCPITPARDTLAGFNHRTRPRPVADD